MDMSGERLIAAPRADVWAALNDPDVLKACIPGAQDFEKTSPTSFAATATQKVGPVKATFKGAVELSDIVEGESYTISGEGKGGAAGFAKGGAQMPSRPRARRVRRRSSPTRPTPRWAASSPSSARA